MTDIPLGKHDVRVNFKKADSSSKEFAFMKAHELNNIEKLIKKQCEHCLGKGFVGGDYLSTLEVREDNKCFRCNGYGHYYEKNIWRTGKNTMKQLIVETDNPDPENLALIVNHLNNLFGYKFNAIKTKHGFHIIGSKIYHTVDASETEQTIRDIVYPDTINHPTNKPKPSDNWYFDNMKVLDKNLKFGCSWKQNLYSLLRLEMKLREYSKDMNYKQIFTSAVTNANLINSIGDFDIFYTVLSLKYGKSTLRISKKSNNDKYEQVIL